jgi:hypothetical protein
MLGESLKKCLSFKALPMQPRDAFAEHTARESDRFFTRRTKCAVDLRIHTHQKLVGERMRVAPK